MEVLRVGFVGIRTSKSEETAVFFRDVIGLDMTRLDPSWSVLGLPTARFDLLEVYGSDFDHARIAPADQPLFLGFIVADLVAAHTELTAGGHPVGEIVWADEAFGNPEYAGFGWFFFQAPDGHAYAVQQAPD